MVGMMGKEIKRGNEERESERFETELMRMMMRFETRTRGID